MNFDNIPQELKQLSRWVCWKLEMRDGRLTKIPYNPKKPDKKSMSNNSNTWSNYETAVGTFSTGQFAGIGFMLGDGYVGVDLDHCISPEGISPEAKDIINILDSYTEVSQSKTGVHILCTGKLPGKKRRKGFIEMYEVGRYFAITGDILDDAHTDVEERTAELNTVYKKYVEVDEKTAEKPSVKTNTLTFSDTEIIRKASEASNGSLFNALMSGNWKGRYGSQSEADMAFCNILAFWTGCDAAAMDRIFRLSDLYRDKWNENRGSGGTYGEITIAEAIKDCKKTYSPGSEKKKSKPKDKGPSDIDMGYDHLDDSEKETLPSWILGPYNDTWNAARFIDKYGENIKFNTNKGWLIWNGKHWEEDRLGKIRIMADDTISDLYKYVPELNKKYGSDSKKYKEFVGWLAKSRNSGRKDNMIREAQSMKGIATLPEEFDKNIMLLNCLNGTIDLKTGKLHAHDRSNLISKMCPVEYDPKAKAPLWDNFMKRIFEGNSDLIDFLRRAIGYSLTGSIKEQCMFILHGVGKNGKSTFLDTIRTLFGFYARNTNASTFMKQENQNTNEVARLQGARVVTTTEPEEGERFSESLIKQATGGEPLTARFLYKESFEFIPEFKIWMGTNHKPKITGNDLGIWRRIRLIPFTVIIPAAEVDVELGRKLVGELPGIFNWALKGCYEWQKEGLKEPKEVLSATDDYRGEMDILQVFLDECTERKEDASINSRDLYSVYERWCEQNGEYKMSSTKFAMKLKERGIRKSRTAAVRTWESMQLTKAGRQLLTGMSDNKKDKYEQETLPWA